MKAMFHQVRLLPRDTSLLCFLWHDTNSECEPQVYEWQVLPFGTKCSLCCATYAVCKHARDDGDSIVIRSVEQAFYVDNCLESLPDVNQAKETVSKIRSVLSKGGFEIHQWASNVPEVVSDLSSEALSSKHEMW